MRRSGHGNRSGDVFIPDSFRWLEESSSPEVIQWLETQRVRTEASIAVIPEVDEFARRMAQLYRLPRLSYVQAVAGHYFSVRSGGATEQSALYVQNTLGGSAQRVVDPDRLDSEGRVSLTGFVPSPSGFYVAYALSRDGSDWTSWHVKDLQTGADLGTPLSDTKFGDVAWLPDSSGFFYVRVRRGQGDGEGVYLHRLGSPQKLDALVYGPDDPGLWGLTVHVVPDGSLLIILATDGDSGRTVLLCQRLGLEARPVRLCAAEGPLGLVGSTNDSLFLLTSHGSPMGRVVALDLAQPEPERWHTVVAEIDEPLEDVVATTWGFVAIYSRDAAHRLVRYARNGTSWGELPLPKHGSVRGLSGHGESGEWFFSFESFAQAPTWHRVLENGVGSPAIEALEPVANEATARIEQHFVTSKDGTVIPLYVVSPPEDTSEVPLPTLLVGYGGFGVSVTPEFSPEVVAWVEAGGRFASACLRGGGEYGEAWHNAGAGRNKQNTFDDLLACAEWLEAKGLAPKRGVVVQGSSNGGLTAAACVMQHPNAFAAAVLDNAVLDMVAYERLGGATWVGEYGSPDDPDMLPILLAYSPYHNVRLQCYPPILITVAAGDDRVNPAHSYKFAAALQAAQTCDGPVLLSVRANAGHSFGSSAGATANAVAAVLAFARSAVRSGH